jgi:toxin CcdB
MSQFQAHKNLDENTQHIAPYVLDVQSALLKSVKTVVALPLVPMSRFWGTPIKVLNPILKIDAQSYVCVTQNMFAIERADLGSIVADFSQNNFEIIDAIDYVLSGV